MIITCTITLLVVYFEEDEPKGGCDSEQDEYGSGDSGTKLNQKENKCLKREGGREGGREGRGGQWDIGDNYFILLVTLNFV